MRWSASANGCGKTVHGFQGLPVSKMSHDEIVTIVDAENRVVGAAPRWQMRAEMLPHRATYILVFDHGGRLFLQKRTATKDIYPGC